MNRAETLKERYHLLRHPEGGWFAEVYTSPSSPGVRPAAGSIYFLLDEAEISHFHRIDCDEIWYYHEGCGLKITVLENGGMEEILLGMETGQRAMALIRQGALFAAENLHKDGYTFLSCATTPAFRYEGFHLASRREIRALYPDAAEKVLALAYENTENP